jgi:spore maturation protein CgeB
MFDARCFGKGYPGYYPLGPFKKTYNEIIHQVFPEVMPDMLVANFDHFNGRKRFDYAGLADLKVSKAIVFRDYWYIADRYHDEFVRIIEDSRIDFILSYFPQPLEIWADSPIANRFVYLPPSFDPRIFNDWQMPKQYDVGFLAAGTTIYSDFYPERFAIHKRLLEEKRIRYLWAPHPGWSWHRKDHPLVGRGFSRAINSCKMFITTSGQFRNAHAKYVEILASKTLLLADEPLGWERLRLEDGVNYVRICDADLIDKIEYYLSHPEMAARIAERGYQTAINFHTCYTRALEFLEETTRKWNAPIGVGRVVRS